jgi:hypothetical protein
LNMRDLHARTKPIHHNVLKPLQPDVLRTNQAWGRNGEDTIGEGTKLSYGDVYLVT